MSSPNSRKQCDFTKLIMHGYEVDLQDGSPQKFDVTFYGPKDTLYEDSVFRVHVELPDQYPFASPSIGFEPHTMFHPNVDERSGSVCLDVINQTWTPLYSLVNIFDTFLPQLLTYPNPSDPLNAAAASLYVKDAKVYQEKVKWYVKSSIERHQEFQKMKEDERTTAMSTGGGSAPSMSEGGNDSNPEIECTEFELREADDDLDVEFD